MTNLVILYNPYYNQEVIEDHIRILNQDTSITEAKVAFGKVRSSRRDYEHPFGDKVDALCTDVSHDNPLQLYLTDFSSVYVCYVEEVRAELGDVKAPKYYEDLEVDNWFIVSDIREIVRDDFEYVRDELLVNFKTPNYGDHTFALYGNRYDYPLMIDQRVPINYFENFSEGERHFTRVFKSKQYSFIQKDLIHYVFGKELLYKMHPDSIESLISAEVDYLEHKDDATHDFSTIVISYAKTFENESYYFLRKLFAKLLEHEPNLENISYSVQGRDYVFRDYLTQKPNMGTNKFLLGHFDVKSSYKSLFNDWHKYTTLLNLLNYELKNATFIIQKIRNEASHGGSISKKECDEVRGVMLGIGQGSIISVILKNKGLIIE